MSLLCQCGVILNGRCSPGTRPSRLYRPPRRHRPVPAHRKELALQLTLITSTNRCSQLPLRLTPQRTQDPDLLSLPAPAHWIPHPPGRPPTTSHIVLHYRPLLTRRLFRIRPHPLPLAVWPTIPASTTPTARPTCRGCPLRPSPPTRATQQLHPHPKRVRCTNAIRNSLASSLVRRVRWVRPPPRYESVILGTPLCGPTNLAGAHAMATTRIVAENRSI